MVVSPCYVPHIFLRDTTGAQDSFQIKVPKTCNEGLTPRPPFLFSAGASFTDPKPLCAAICRIHYLIRIAPAERPSAGGIGMRVSAAALQTLRVRDK